jgi:hypothetical protein
MIQVENCKCVSPIQFNSNLVRLRLLRVMNHRSYEPDYDGSKKKFQPNMSLSPSDRTLMLGCFFFQFHKIEKKKIKVEKI